MVRMILLLIMILSGAASRAQGRVAARVTGFASDKGVCRACLFTSEASYAKGTDPFRCVQVAVAGREATVQFENLPDGRYALALFHDANNNNRMDKNFLGIPREGYGASRNQLPFAAAPGFKENAFDVAGTATVRLEIRIRNIGL
ncbi:DUF2141 domain-containing protein [Paraflavisolibacter sp. H34]|uniref:DUF2141 domain-containing protein n=1 Tax=Huijunlia imazamoxiresistens TaxID=3127457 RepID=UPI00301A445A